MTEYKLNVKVVGNPTINGTVVSEFSANDYLETPNKITLADGDKLEIGFLTKAPSASSTNTSSNIYNGDDKFILNISGGNVYYLTTNIKKSNNVLSNDSFSPYYIEPEEEVYCKFIIDNSTKKMTCGFSRDGINYEYEHRNTSPSLYIPLDSIMSIGKGSTKTGASPCTTYIDLSKCYIKINDEYVWKGAEVLSKSYIAKRKVRTFRKRFVLPVLTSNGTMGGDTFAVACSTPKTAEYEMFNTGADGTKGVDTYSNMAPQWVSFYNPVPLKVTQLRIGQIKDTTQAQYYYITAYKIQVSDDNQTWTDVYSGTGSKPATTLTANIADSGYHKYYRVYVTSAQYYSGYPRVFFFGIDFEAEAEDAVFYDDEVKSYVAKTKKRKYYKEDIRYNKVGSPTVEEGIASGFSSGKYLTLKNDFNPSKDANWQVCLKFKPTASMSDAYLFGYLGEGLFKIGIGNNKLKLLLSSSVSSWNIGTYSGTTALELNTWYMVRLVYWKSTSSFELDLTKADNINFKNEVNTGTVNYPVFGTPTTIGAGQGNGLEFKGEIDLKESYINPKINLNNTNKYFLYTKEEVSAEDYFDPVACGVGQIIIGLDIVKVYSSKVNGYLYWKVADWTNTAVGGVVRQCDSSGNYITTEVILTKQDKPTAYSAGAVLINSAVFYIDEITNYAVKRK